MKPQEHMKPGLDKKQEREYRELQFKKKNFVGRPSDPLARDEEGPEDDEVRLLEVAEPRRVRVPLLRHRDVLPVVRDGDVPDAWGCASAGQM